MAALNIPWENRKMQMGSNDKRFMVTNLERKKIQKETKEERNRNPIPKANFFTCSWWSSSWQSQLMSSETFCLRGKSNSCPGEKGEETDRRKKTWKWWNNRKGNLSTYSSPFPITCGESSPGGEAGTASLPPLLSMATQTWSLLPSLLCAPPFHSWGPPGPPVPGENGGGPNRAAPGFHRAHSESHPPALLTSSGWHSVSRVCPRCGASTGELSLGSCLEQRCRPSPSRVSNNTQHQALSCLMFYKNWLSGEMFLYITVQQTQFSAHFSFEISEAAITS